MALSLNPALYVHPLDAASDQAMVVCEVPAQKDSSLRFAVPVELLELLRLFDGRRQTAEVVAAYDKLYPGKYTLDKIEKLISSFFLPKSLLVDTNAPAFLPEQSKRPSYVYAKLRLIPPHVIYPVAQAFRWAFSKPVLTTWAVVFVAAHLFFYLWILPGSRLNINDLTGIQFLQVALLSLAAAFVHETGHASALAAYGCKQAEIGVGLYIYFPVLYTDVSEAWKLSRHQRAVIDIAGIYFQSVVLFTLLGLYLTTGSKFLLYAFLFIDITIANTLNPFLRMDGYWLVADLFGIFNLREQSANFIRAGWSKLFRPKRRAVAPLLNLSRNAKIALGVYTILCAGFFLYLSTFMFRQAVYYLIPNYPKRLLALWQAVQASPLDVAAVVGMVFEILWRSLVLFGLSFFAYRLIRSLWRMLRRSARSVTARFVSKPNLQEQAGRP